MLRAGTQLTSVLTELGVEAMTRQHMLDWLQPSKGGGYEARHADQGARRAITSLNGYAACRPFSGKAVASPSGAGQLLRKA